MNGRAILFLLAAGASLMLAGCVSREAVVAASPAPTSPAPIFVPRVSTNNEIRWLTTKNVLDNRTVPEEVCSQAFTIRGTEELIWELNFAEGRTSFGAIIFRRSNDLAAIRSGASLRFRVKPASAAAHLGVALVDVNGVATERPVLTRAAKEVDAWLVCELPLSEFSAEVGVMAADGARRTATFDWSAVSEFRFIADGQLKERVTADAVRIWKEASL